MEEKVLEILMEVLEDNTIDSNCSQENCEKWDSMAQLNLSVDVSLEPEQIAEMKSVKDICRIISEIK